MIYLEREQLRALKARARAERISLAELLRRLVQANLDQSSPLPPVPADAHTAMVAIGSSGVDDVADRHDEYLGKALRREHAR